MTADQVDPGTNKQSTPKKRGWLAVILIAALLVWIMVSVLPKGGSVSKSAEDRSRLRQIGVALYLYTDGHDHAFPIHPRDIADSFDDADSELLRDSRIFLNPYQDEGAVADRGAFDEPATRFGGYVFLNHGLAYNEIVSPSEFILAYTAKVSEEQKKRHVLFADGHVEGWEEEKFRAALPEGVDVDALDGP